MEDEHVEPAPSAVPTPARAPALHFQMLKLFYHKGPNRARANSRTTYLELRSHFALWREGGYNFTISLPQEAGGVMTDKPTKVSLYQQPERTGSAVPGQ